MVDATTITTDPIRTEFRRLALAASHGDKKAEAKLVELETRIADTERAERRRAAAEAEAQRVAAEAADQAAVDLHEAKVVEHGRLVGQRLDGYRAIEAATQELAAAVRLTLDIDAEVWSAALRLGWSPETRTASVITNYCATQLGRLGAGLGDMPTPMHPALQGDLVSKEQP